MPPARVTSGWMTSTWLRSISCAKAPARGVLLTTGDARLDGVGELGVAGDVVRPERLFHPVRSNTPRSGAPAGWRDPRSASRVRYRTSGRPHRRQPGGRPAATRATSRSASQPKGPQPSLMAVKPVRHESGDGAFGLCRGVRHQGAGVGADRRAMRPARGVGDG